MSDLERFREASWEVIEQLRAYQGEIIVAHEHPLHHAVVALEGLSQKTRQEDRQNLLMYPINHLWFLLLNISRGRPGRRFLNPAFGRIMDSMGRLSRRNKALFVAAALQVAVESSMNFLIAYENNTHTLPVPYKTYLHPREEKDGHS